MLKKHFSRYFHATPTLFTGQWERCPKRLFVLVQGLEKLRPAVFKQLLTIDIFFKLDSVHIGCGILPKACWQRPHFSPSRWSEVISGLRVMHCWSGSPQREKAIQNGTKLQMRCRPEILVWCQPRHSHHFVLNTRRLL